MRRQPSLSDHAQRSVSMGTSAASATGAKAAEAGATAAVAGAKAADATARRGASAPTDMDW